MELAYERYMIELGEVESISIIYFKIDFIRFYRFILVQFCRTKF
jgi:hypothetical protein